MDSSTVTFLLVAVAIFITIRWVLGSQDAQRQEEEERRRQQLDNTGGRQVTQSMVDVVQALNPTLNEDDIRQDLERTRNVEQTVENLMQAPSSKPSGSTQSKLLHKYNLKQEDLQRQVSDEDELQTVEKPQWSNDRQERQQQLKKQQQEMVLRARQRMQLKEQQNKQQEE